jgi:serine/threonine-protein kinase
MDKVRWRQLEDLFDRALSLEPAAREKFLADVARSDPAVHIELAALLRAHESAGGFLSGAAPEPRGIDSTDTGSLAPETRLGAWRIVRFLSHGGMGEVYEAARADGQYEQRAALKLTRREAVKLLERFSAERQMLARLDHPGIARLLDGGVADDGRPFAVMEFVEGRTIVEWCAYRKLPLRERLKLFLQVCDAVAHAHGHLIVHRDLKPSNVLVDSAGRVRLLDFGIAKPLDAVWPGGAAATETAALMTPDYAAPEQLAGEPITTATDVYGLGMLLFEILTGRRPWQHDGRPIAKVVHDLLDTPAPRASDIARANGDAPIPARELGGDLDAIAAKCLRRESVARYQTVNELRRDVSSALDGAPVAARGDARSYLVGKFVRRHRWAVAAAFAFVALLAAGIAATSWQARRATLEAKRAERARDFLIGVFKGSDPRIAQDKPRGQVTARELLDASVARIDQEFASDPSTLIELHGVATQIYRELDEKQRYEEMQRRHLALAREHYGEAHPIVLSALLEQAAWAIDTLDRPQAARLIEALDPLIKRAGADRTAIRARWWLIHGQTMFGDSSRKEEQLVALRKADDLFAEVAPSHPARVTALADIGAVHANRMEYAAAKEFYERSIALAETVKDRNDAELATIYGNLGQALVYSGDFPAADDAYRRSEEIIVRTYGKGHLAHWANAANRARAAHLGGNREIADTLFTELFRNIPPDSPHHQAHSAREMYGACRAAEGRPYEAVPLLEAADWFYQHTPMYDFELPRVRLALGDAYDRAGRVEEARKAIKWALDKRIETVPAESQPLMAARERWGRFLLSQGDVAGAEEQFTEILEHAQGRKLAHISLAHGGIARIALTRRDLAKALTASTRALELFDQVTGFRDVRMGPYLWLIHSEVLRHSGDHEGARTWAKRTLDARRRYDHPAAVSIAEAETALRAASSEPRGM